MRLKKAAVVAEPYVARAVRYGWKHRRVISDRLLRLSHEWRQYRGINSQNRRRKR